MYFYAHQLQQDDYGRYQSFFVQLNIFNAVVGLGIAIFSLTYPTEKIRQLISSIHPKYYFYYGLFLVSAGLLLGFLQEGNQVNILWSVAFLAAFALCNISDALLIIFRKFKFLVLINSLYAVGFFAIHFAFIESPFRLNALLVALLPLLLLKLIFSSWILFRHSLKDKLQKPFDNAAFKGMYVLWAHLYLYDMLQIASLWLDKFIVSLLMDSNEIATYINGTYNIPFLPIIFSAIISSALIHLSEKNTVQERLQTVHQIGQILSSVAFPIAAFFIFFRTEFIVFFFSDKYLESVPIFLCAILIIPFRAYGHTVLLQNLEQGKIINQGAIIDIIVAVAMMYPLYLLMGLPGVALGFTISTLVQSLFYGIKTKKHLGVSFWSLYPIKNWVVKIVSFALIGALSYYLMPETWSNNVRLFTGAAAIGIPALAVFYYELKNNDKNLFSALKEKRNK